MSREDLNNFYYAVEHNYALKLKLSKCDKNTGKWYKNKQSPHYVDDPEAR